MSFSLLFLFLFLVSREKKTADISIKEAAPKLLALMNADALQEENILKVRARYGLEDWVMADVVYYGPVSNMDAEELLIIKMISTEYAETVRTSFESRIAYQTTCFENYGVDQMALIQSAKIVIQGPYAMLSISSNAAAAEELFLSLLKGGQ